MWYYDSSIGRLYVELTSEGAYGFRFRDDPAIWEACSTPEDEISNISAHATNCAEWDFSAATAPSVLSEWVHIPDPR